jgi:hypothetical protein
MGEMKIEKCTVDLVGLKLLATTRVTTVFVRRTSFLPELLKMDGLIDMNLKVVLNLNICRVLCKGGAMHKPNFSYLNIFQFSQDCLEEQ